MMLTMEFYWRCMYNDLPTDSEICKKCIESCEYDDISCSSWDLIPLYEWDEPDVDNDAEWCIENLFIKNNDIEFIGGD